MKRVVVLISGRGSNLRSLIDAQASSPWHVVKVISNQIEAGGLAIAQAAGVETEVVDHRAFAERADFDAALAKAIDAAKPHLVVLAGFMRVLTAGFVDHFAGRLINVHPSLLPAFTGLNTHQRAIDAGCKFAGCTVHFVTAELDHGPIILQAVVVVLPDDDAASLAARVLAEEHRILPLSVDYFCRDALVVDGQRVRVKLT